MTRIGSQDIVPKMFLIKDLSKLDFLDLTFMADKGRKAQHLVSKHKNSQKKSKFGVSNDTFSIKLSAEMFSTSDHQV